MKKVLFFLSSLEEGGAQRVVSILANRLVEEDFDVEILTYYNEVINYELNNKVKYNSVIKETNTNNIFFNSLWLNKYFEDNSDVIVSFLAPFNILSILLKGNKPIIVADRNDPNKVPKNKYVRKLRDVLYKRANVVILQTENNRNYFNKLSNTRVIYNPVDLKQDAGLALKTEKKNKIVTVARLMPQKNLTMLIDAFYEIKKQYNDYSLFIYGDGPLKHKLEDQITSLRLNDSVILAGNSNDVFNEIKDAKMFVLSSNYEGMPNSLIEAMCLGLPVITTRVSGTEELIDEGVNGLIIDIGNKEQLVTNMKLLIEDEKLRNKLGNNATKISKKLSLDKICQQWIDCINETINE